MLKTFKELVAWQKSFSLCTRVYRYSQEFPKEERFGLTAQMRRAAVSVPSNVAEGYGRATRPDYLRFLWISNGSLAELETHLLLAQELGFGDAAACAQRLAETSETGLILKSLIRSLDVENPQKTI